MCFRRIAAKSCVLLLSCVFISKLEVVAGLRQKTRNTSTENGNRIITYVFYKRPEYAKDCLEVRDKISASLDEYSGVYLIKPDGNLEPFEVYCDNDLDSGGWMVFQRGTNGFVTFNRNWKDYARGFGFLSSEFWLGNEKLSYVTNQAVYELRIDVMLADGSSFYATYDSFRISDEWSNYKLIALGTYRGTAIVTQCPPNMVYGNCTCQRTCGDSSGSESCSDIYCAEVESCVCADGFLKNGDDCVLPSECGCFQADYGSVIPNNMVYVNAVCSEKCICLNNQLICEAYGCSPTATCRVSEGEGKCHCNEGYRGNGEMCRLYEDCYDVYQAGHTQNGVYTILPDGWPRSPFNVYCDMTTSEGGWTVFQRRADGITDFYRNWISYRNGFGSLENDRDFWLGNEKLFHLVNNRRRQYTLRVDIITFEGTHMYEFYTSFKIGNEHTKYQLKEVGDYSGTAGDGMQFTQGSDFSTYDEDNDGCIKHNCAERHMGAWWYDPSAFEYYNPCESCHEGSLCDQFEFKSGCSTVCAKSNLNGNYSDDKGVNIYWNFSSFCKLSRVEMKIRPS